MSFERLLKNVDVKLEKLMNGCIDFNDQDRIKQNCSRTLNFIWRAQKDIARAVEKKDQSVLENYNQLLSTLLCGGDKRV